MPAGSTFTPNPPVPEEAGQPSKVETRQLWEQKLTNYLTIVEQGYSQLGDREREAETRFSREALDKNIQSVAIAELFAHMADWQQELEKYPDRKAVISAEEEEAMDNYGRSKLIFMEAGHAFIESGQAGAGPKEEISAEDMETELESIENNLRNTSAMPELAASLGNFKIKEWLQTSEKDLPAELEAIDGFSYLISEGLQKALARLTKEGITAEAKEALDKTVAEMYRVQNLHDRLELSLRRESPIEEEELSEMAEEDTEKEVDPQKIEALWDKTLGKHFGGKKLAEWFAEEMDAEIHHDIFEPNDPDYSRWRNLEIAYGKLRNDYLEEDLEERPAKIPQYQQRLYNEVLTTSFDAS